MDLDLIKKLVKIVDSSGVTDLELEENGLKIKIVKKIRSQQVVTQAQIPVASAQPVIQPAAETAKQKSEAEALVPNALLDEVALIGPNERIVERLGPWKEAGKRGEVGSMLLSIHDPNVLELFAREML